MRIRIAATLAVLAAGLGTSPSFSADLITKAPRMMPTWTGWYAGVNVGGGWGTGSNSFAASAGGVTIATGSDTTSVNGIIGGGQLGYNWQSGNIVYGVETDIQGSGQRGSDTTVCAAAACGPGGTIAHTDRLTWFGTTRGRVGMLVTNDWLAYATGGAAYGTVKSDVTTTGAGPVIDSATNSATRFGWTVGAGLEGKLMANWTWKVEYLYMDLGTANFSNFFPNNGFTQTQSLHFRDNIARLGVNYRF